MGKVIAYPTDTIYGLGVDICNEEAAQKLFNIKDRKIQNPVSILYPDKSRLFDNFPGLNDYQRNFVEKLLPGQITLLLPVPKNSNLLPYFRKDGFTGVRVVEHAKMNQILSQYKHPISTTSINPSGEEPANTIEEILNYFTDKIKLILYDQRDHKTIPSTIIKVTKSHYNILRKGAISQVEIENSL